MLDKVKYIGNDTQSLAFSVDYVDYSVSCNKILNLQAWVLKPGSATEPCDVRVILWNEETSIGYVLPTAVVQRQDVTKHFNHSVSYDYAGCAVNVPLTRTNLPKGTYEIVLSRWADDRYYDCRTQQRIEV